MSSGTKLCTMLLIIVVISFFTYSPAISSFSNSVIMKSQGAIDSNKVTARSGSARDIQSAVDAVAAVGQGSVYIPEGTFNFVEIGETWQTVTIPAGVSLIGATTERDADGQVVAWKTVLAMPYDVPGNDAVGIRRWFVFSGIGDPNKSSRFSDIKLSGYRDINSTSPNMNVGVRFEGVVNFRVDHCYFSNLGGSGVQAAENYGTAGHYSSGVVDHCKLINSNGIPAPYDARTVDYGVYARGWDNYRNDWNTNVDNVLGKYNINTVFVEDCYLSKWRHCAVARQGAHVVVRHCTIQYDCGYGSTDIHGDEPGRALEIYDDNFLECSGTSHREAIWYRAGCGVVFNNTVDNSYTVFAYLTRENPDSTYYPEYIWVWSNTLPSGLSPVVTDGGPQLNVDYFLYAKSGYAPYVYPHTLTLQP